MMTPSGAQGSTSGTDTVYQHLRVAETGNDVSTTHSVYNGVSANTWLTPIGMTARRKTPEIADECLQTINHRAKSAGSFLGRRHFDRDKQELKKDEILSGRSFEFVRHDTREQIAARAKRPNTCACAKITFREGDLPRPSVRPHTSGGELRGISSRGRKALEHLPSVTVTSLEVKEVKQPKVIPVRSKRKVTILAGDTISFRSVREMKDAYKEKSQNAPEERCMRAQGITQGAVVSPRLSPHPRKPRRPQSSLRPLMYDTTLSVPHGAGCPYGCQGCFRACLASDEYFQKMDQSLQDSGRPAPKRRHVTWTRVRAPLRAVKREHPVEKLSVVLASPAHSSYHSNGLPLANSSIQDE